MHGLFALRTLPIGNKVRGHSESTRELQRSSFKTGATELALIGPSASDLTVVVPSTGNSHFSLLAYRVKSMDVFGSPMYRIGVFELPYRSPYYSAIDSYCKVWLCVPCPLNSFDRHHLCSNFHHSQLRFQSRCPA